VRILLLGVAGALGALARYGLSTAVGTRPFPWSTLGVNLAGSLALGVLVELAAQPGTRVTDDVRLVVGVGFLGAFTTFSTFSVESVEMLRDGRGAAALTYVVASVAGGLAMVAVGYRLAAGR
jgi:fluoride exporter